LVDSVEVTGDAPGTAAVISSWAQIGHAASAGNSRPFVSCGRAVPALQRFGLSDELTSRLRRGADADPAPGWGNYRPDHFTRDIALDYLVERRPRFLFIGLGDTDELAHKGDYRGYLAALRAADEFAAELMAALGELEKQGQRWTLMITTDHGRGHNFQDHGAGYPESARSFLLAAGHGIASRGLVDLAQTRYLADIAPTVHRLLGMQLPQSGSGVLLWELLSWQ
jgi:arylsulfatase A-like enzyme